MGKKPKKSKKIVPPTPEQRLATLGVERDTLVSHIAQRRALGSFDANSASILEALQACLEIIDYLISLNERDMHLAKTAKG
jgi:hypothetical protein